MLKKLLVIILSCLLTFPIFADKKDDIIKQQNETIQKLTKENIDLKTALDITTKALEETTNTLTESTALIIKLKERIEKDAAEIKDLREQLEYFVGVSGEIKNIAAGIAITYPIGGEVIFEVFIPKLPIGFFGLARVYNETTFGFNAGAGLVFRF